MNRFLLTAISLWAMFASAAPAAFHDVVPTPQAPANAPGFPTSASAADLRAGFVTPPPGYGEVPFWWWTGDPLDRERLLWQLDKLHAAGIPGVQVNYAHDTKMVTYPADPPIFSDKWWEIWRWMTEECQKRGMGIGMSGYTVDWPGHDNLFYQIGLTDGSLRGADLKSKTLLAEGGKPVEWPVPVDALNLTAYRAKDGIVAPGKGRSLLALVQGGTLRWTPPAGQWQIVAVFRHSPERSIDPMNPASGAKVVERFFQPFADHCPGDTANALNYFFHDELTFGVEGWLWSERFPEEFKKRKGYDILPLLPALFADIGPKTPKVRLDYSDVMVTLSEENFFRPIFEWHWKRGIMFACDPGSRGTNPLEFGDYFRTVRWYAAPGHDTPGGKADLHKDKVSSSIAHLYQRPRVWLEGYHSLGWGATPATIFDSSCKNFLYGASLLNLHGLYYTTHGGYWEWAPPCFHFRMPYWDHMSSFFKYFERLSYLLSQGVHRCDVAMLYPNAPLEAGLGKDAMKAAFELGDDLYLKHGIDYDFMDFESLARAEIKDRQLHVAGEAYRVLILPSMRAVRQSTLDQALAFYRAGGVVLATGPLPEASDRAGRNDRKLDAAVREVFGVTAAEARKRKTAAPQANASGGAGAALPNAEAVASMIDRAIPRDFVPETEAQVLHRKIGEREVYMVMGAKKNSDCAFRATGAVQLWNPWTGDMHPILTVRVSDGVTHVRMPLDVEEPQIVVFEPYTPGAIIEQTDLDDVAAVEEREGKITVTGYANSPGAKTAVVRKNAGTVTLRGTAPAPIPPVELGGLWDVELKPTLDNRWGDFRLPASEGRIGAEARRFVYTEENRPNPGWQDPRLDDATWKHVTCSFGTYFLKLGPVSEEEPLLEGSAALEPPILTTVNNTIHLWEPYDYSMRLGVENDPGPQGWHGLKEKISDAFIVLGKPVRKDTEFVYEKEPQGGRNYLWTTVQAPRAGDAFLRTGDLKPAAVWLNGARVENLDTKLSLHPGANPLLLRFDAPGRTYAVVEFADVAERESQTPLSMRWYENPAVAGFDAHPRAPKPAGWYRFTAPPGLRAMTLVVRGKLQAWADGEAMTLSAPKLRPDGALEYRAIVSNPAPCAAKVALRIEQERGVYGGAAIPEPVALECGPGRMELGDWSKLGALADYSGGVWYRKTLTLSPEQTQGRVLLDVGRVCATAEVRINGQTAGTLITSPWKIDVSKWVKPGENHLEILVYNTLANHYATIPTRYRGETESGLLGPVRMVIDRPVTLAQETN